MNTTPAGEHVVHGTMRGAPISFPLTPYAYRAFERAQATGFVKITKASAWADCGWWAWCEAHARPFVSLRLRPRTARLFVDLRPAGSNFTPSGRAALLAAFKRAGARKWGCGGDAAHCVVPRAIGEALARELLAIAWACVRETREACR